MNVLIACESSGAVRDAFTAQGHNAFSVDLLPSETPGQHIQGDIFTVLPGLVTMVDLMICFPPCTHLCSSGARWWRFKAQEQGDAIRFANYLFRMPIPKIAMENPIGILSKAIRKPEQIIQPWQFGHGETKATCLWLKNLPPLVPTNVVPGRVARIHRMPPSPNRSKERSRTYAGIAKAMAEQWG